MIMGSCLGRNTSTNKLNTKATTSSLVSSCLGRQSTDEQDLDLVSNRSDSYRQRNIIYRIWNYKRKKKSSHYLDKFWQHQDNTNYAKLNNGNQVESYSDIQLQNLDVNNLLITSGHTKETAVNYLPSRVSSSRASSSLDLEWEHEYTQMRHYNQPLSKQKLQLQPAQNYSQLSIMASSCNNRDETSADESWRYMNQDEDQSMTSLSSLAAPNDSLCNASNKTRERENEKRRLFKTNNRIMRTGSITRNSSHNSWSHISTPESLEWDIDEDQQQQLKMEDDNLDHETLKLLHQIEQLKNRVLYETGEGLYDVLDNDPQRFNREYMSNNITTTAKTLTTTNRSTKCFQLGDSDGENGNYS